MKIEERNLKNQRLLLDAGNPPPPTSKKYKKLNERLSKLTQEFQSNRIELLQYMHKIAFTLHEPAEAGPQSDLGEAVAEQQQDTS